MIEKERKLYEARIENFIRRLKSLFYEDAHNLDIKCCKFDPHVDFKGCKDGNYGKIEKKVAWGENWERAWFHVTGQVPSNWQGRHVVARINLGGESLVFNDDGLPFAALSVHTIWPLNEFWRDRIHIAEKSRGSEKISYWIESSAGELFGVKLEEDQGNIAPKRYGYHAASVQYAELAVFRKDIWDLYLDCYVLNDLMKSLPENMVRRKRILRTLGLAIDQFTGDEKSTNNARDILKPELHKASANSDLQTLGVGHAHIDTAWLWPVHETIRKCARTFASQIDLLEKYPGYVFGASQAQHYQYVKIHYPELYKKIHKKVKEGRWEVQGGMWVEADCNIISGESMVRQFLHGKKFFQDEFNIDVRNLWLPDVFGYSAAMPQILLKSGINFFLTQKLSWNQFNRFPHHTFVWRGIDGSEVVTHFPPEDNYNSDLRPAALIKARDNFDENDRLDEFLTMFGVGDGGSGPTEEIIETGLRQANTEGAPRVKFGHAQHMFDRLIEQKDKLDKWVGELYFELHRGTLTTQAHNKKMNRRLELKLRQVEILYSLLPYDKYPAEELDRIWKVVLLNQFHDIIPGSSITPVYETTFEEYRELDESTDKLGEQVANLLLNSDENTLTIINTLSDKYHRPILLPKEWCGYELTDELGQNITVQSENGNAVISMSLEPLQICTISRSEKKLPSSEIQGGKDFNLENDLIRYEFNNQGVISRIFDKELKREVLTEKGFGNVFSYYEDRPVNWDAWDVDIYYEKQLLEKARLVKREWISDGPVRSGFRQELAVGNSTIIQEIYLDKKSKRIDFETFADWHEDHKMLRVSFEVDIFFDLASFEIQFGHVRRNTHRNTSWDMAKFEVVGHRYADLSDHDYGVALLNDCKYGYKIYDNVIDLNLLRSPTMPDPHADRGEHRFTFSLLPHQKQMIDSDVISEAAQLNQPPVIFPGKEGQGKTFPIKLDSERVILDTIKKAERDNSTILRIYEPRGTQVNTSLEINMDSYKVFETDLMENDIEKLSDANGKIDLSFKPFEIKTIRILTK